VKRGGEVLVAVPGSFSLAMRTSPPRSPSEIGGSIEMHPQWVMVQLPASKFLPMS
jgi:hypothetical protein